MFFLMIDFMYSQVGLTSIQGHRLAEALSDDNTTHLESPDMRQE
jgi:hypothetical protein